MKIVVTSTGKKGKIKTFTIEVFDEGRVIYTELVEGLHRRDEAIWRLAELYNALDIDTVEGKEEFRYTEIPTVPVLEESEADEFFEENSEFVYSRILQAVSEGIKAKQDSIRLFELNGSGVYMTSNRSEWKIGVQQALDYFLSVEQYDKCIIARQLMSEL